MEIAESISADDLVFVVGRNEYGELGVGHKNCIESLVSFTQKPDTDINANNIYCGNQYTIITTHDNEYLSVCYNKDGECGIGNFHDCIDKLSPLNILKNII